MKRVPFVILWLTLIPAAFGFTIEDPAWLSIPSNFAACSNLDALLTERDSTSPVELFESLYQFGSLTGFIDYSFRDSMLRFLDEFVMGSLPNNDLHSLMVSVTGGDVRDLEYPAFLLRDEESEAAELQPRVYGARYL